MEFDIPFIRKNLGSLKSTENSDYFIQNYIFVVNIKSILSKLILITLVAKPNLAKLRGI